MTKRNRILFLIAAFLLVGLFSSGVLFGFLYSAKSPRILSAEIKNQNNDVLFLLEIYDKIKENYWDKVSDENLTKLYKLALEKVTAAPVNFAANDRRGLGKTLEDLIQKRSQKEKKDLTVNTANLVLANLSPFGRSGLYTTKEEKNLKERVQNINPTHNLYDDFGLPQGASESAVKEAFEKKTTELKPHQKDPEIKKKIDDLTYAYGVLSKPEEKKTYDTSGAEPTVFTKPLGEAILYLKIKQLSPTTFDEFQNQVSAIKGGDGLNSLILDLRGNIGGSIDILPYFLGPFIGENQYAYEFFHQGNYEPFKTKAGFLPGLIRFKKVVVLIDNEVQSSGEVMAATLKKYNVGVLVGTTTKGWGTVEKVFPLEVQIDQSEKYSIFLVHSLTLREDEQPIEGHGVEPTVSTKEGNWERKLDAYFNTPELTAAVKKLVTLSP